MVCLPALVVTLDEQCKDPLFETHWYGKPGYASKLGGHIQVLNSIPTVKTGLTLCPRYNGRASCCSEEFEHEQAKYFEFFRTMIFPSKVARIRTHHQSVRDVMNTAGYNAATRVEREQLQLALERFNRVLHPVINSECFSALLKYVAGMNCFACRPDWFAYVTQEDGEVLRLHVHPSVCMELWAACEMFGESATALKQALLDSALAKQAKKEAEDLDMFVDQQSLCDWMHDQVALHPFRRPTEAEREAAMRPPRHEVDRRRLQDGPEDNDGPEGVDILMEGGASTFDTTWRFSGSSAAAPRGLRGTGLVARLLPTACAALATLGAGL